MEVLTRFPGADSVLAAQAAALPQPDQLCGPFAARAALHAVLAEPPSVVDLAAAAGTAVWPHDVPAWRPDGAPLDTTGWDRLPRAASAAASGTDATGVARALAAVPGVEAVAVPGPSYDGLRALLGGLASAAYPVGVIANVWTGALLPAWAVGHFVVLWGFDGESGESGEGGLVGLADSYAELGSPEQPPGCRLVPLRDLVAALAEPPGRGLLLVVRPADTAAVRALVTGAGLATGLWTT